jgi:hypothetical protein
MAALCSCFSCLAEDPCSASYKARIAELEADVERYRKMMQAERETSAMLKQALERARRSVNEAADRWTSERVPGYHT